MLFEHVEIRKCEVLLFRGTKARHLGTLPKAG